MANADIIAVVERLVEAENTRSRDASAKELATDFLGITRGRGVEQTRDWMLDEVENPKSTAKRQLEKDPWVRQSGELAVVRSVVQMPDAAAPSGVKRFRNLHVLTREAGEWKCLAWQVTTLS